MAQLSSAKVSQLQNSTIHPRMYLSIEGYVLDPQSGAIVYEIEVGIQKHQIVKVHKVKKRYSELIKFDESVRGSFKESRFLQPFPPKKVFGNKEEKFLKERAKALQNYISNLTRVNALTRSAAFVRTFEIDEDLLADI